MLEIKYFDGTYTRPEFIPTMTFQNVLKDNLYPRNKNFHPPHILNILRIIFTKSIDGGGF